MLRAGRGRYSARAALRRRSLVWPEVGGGGGGGGGPGSSGGGAAMKRDVRILLLGEGKAGGGVGSCGPPGGPGPVGCHPAPGGLSPAGEAGGNGQACPWPRSPGWGGELAARETCRPLWTVAVPSGRRCQPRGLPFLAAPAGEALAVGSLQHPRAPRRGRVRLKSRTALPVSAPRSPAGQGHRRPLRPRTEPPWVPRV